MRKIELQNALIVNPDLIEEGLTFKEKEVEINQQKYDLLFVDEDGKDVYVAMKFRLTDHVLGRFLCNAAVVKDPVRFMIVGCSELIVLKIRKKVGQRRNRKSNAIEKHAYLVVDNVDLKKRLQRIESDQEAVRGENYVPIGGSPDISSEALK